MLNIFSKDFLFIFTKQRQSCFVLIVSIAEVERLWIRFQQLGCNKDGELTDDAIRKSEYNQDVFMRNVNIFFLFLRYVGLCGSHSAKCCITSYYSVLYHDLCLHMLDCTDFTYILAE